jgi:hypothetical protein
MIIAQRRRVTGLELWTLVRHNQLRSRRQNSVYACRLLSYAFVFCESFSLLPHTSIETHRHTPPGFEFSALIALAASNAHRCDWRFFMLQLPVAVLCYSSAV